MAFVVHEMASAWLANPEVHANAMLEAAVANALLQLKANLFMALERHKNVRGELGGALFQANRTYAAAARKAANNKDGLEGLLELEDSVLWREKIERQFLSGEFISAPGAAVIFERDFRELYILGDDTVLDYSLINYQPPDRGLIGASKGLRYVGIKLAAGSLSLFDLGAAQVIEDLCRPLVRTYSSPPGAPDRQRQVELVLPDSFKEKVDLESLAQRVYDRVVAPFEPLGKSLVFSPDGMLAAVPFHALINNKRYLIEEKNIAYCHSMLQRESLTARQSSSLLGSPPPIEKVAVILGNPNYDEMHLPSLPGTGIEVTEVAALLINQKFKDGTKVYDGVRTHTGAQATASQLLEIEQPTIVHIAAHGTFDKKQTRIFTDPTPTLGRYYRRSQRMGSEPLTALDNSLLHSTLVLAKDIEAEDDPANGSILTALELASLNLTHCNVVVLSACETGAGAAESGAGVLGFQYALQACFARGGLLSLWKVLDRETSAFMIDFYQNAAGRNFKAAYLATLRKHCRRDGKRVHPYYWAAFVFMDQTY
jgi:CHAT domain-containing protein